MAQRTALFGRAATLDSGPLLPDKAETVEISILHELAYPLEDASESITIDIDPFSPPKQVTIKSRVLTAAARRLGSPEYLAAIRRRKARAISKAIEGLADRAANEDFVVWTHECLDRLRQLIHQLSEAEQYSDPQHEGNSCEILRQIRDSFLNSGWERYREADVRRETVLILRRLGEVNEVTPEDAGSCMDRLLHLGLDVAVGMPLFNDEEDEIPD